MLSHPWITRKKNGEIPLCYSDLNQIANKMSFLSKYLKAFVFIKSLQKLSEI